MLEQRKEAQSVHLEQHEGHSCRQEMRLGREKLGYSLRTLMPWKEAALQGFEQTSDKLYLKCFLFVCFVFFSFPQGFKRIGEDIVWRIGRL